MPGPNFRGRPRNCTKCAVFKQASEFDGNRGRCRTCSPPCTKTPEEREKQRRADRRLPNRFSTARSQTLHHPVKWLISFKDWAPLMSKPCHYCGMELDETGKGLDRIDHSKHYEIGNVNPCCGTCNHVRSLIFTVAEMERLGAVIASIKRERAANAQPKVSVWAAVHGNRAEPEAIPDPQMTLTEVLK